MKRIFVTATLIAILTTTISCKSKQAIESSATPNAAQTPAVEIVDIRWRLIMLGDETVPATVNAYISFAAEQNRVSGNDGCNQFFGTCQFLPDSGVRFSAMGSTKKMCFDVNIGNQFYPMLESAVRYAVHGDAFELFNADNKTIGKFGKESD